MTETGAGQDVDEPHERNSRWPGFPDWKWDEVPPLAPCRRPQCRQVVKWKAGAHTIGNGDAQDWFCSNECLESFWDSHDHWQMVIADLVRSRDEHPEFWVAKMDAWWEQYEVCWWQLSRYRGVRRGGTKWAVARWHEFNFEVGRAIARAAEAEALLESLAAMLDPEAEPGLYSGRRASDTLKDLRANAHRWPRAEQLIRQLCDAAEEGQEHRNWLVHSHVVPSLDGEWAELQKPARRAEHWERRRFKVEQINRIAARFVWVYTAISYAVNLRHAEAAATIVEPLGPPPPVHFDWSPVPGRSS